MHTDDDGPGPKEGRPARGRDEGGTPPDGNGGEEPRLGVAEDEQIEERIGVTEAEHLREIDHLRSELDRERERGAELRDQLVRTAADFDNFRKRVERDRTEERRQAAAGLVRNLLPALDGIGRALASAGAPGGSPELASFVAGVGMVQAQLTDVLRQAGLERVPTEGLFDPMEHEALLQEAAPGRPNMTILEVFEPGYRFGGRLLRPARVKVALNPAGPAPDAEPEGDAGEDPGSDEA